MMFTFVSFFNNHSKELWEKELETQKLVTCVRKHSSKGDAGDQDPDIRAQSPCSVHVPFSLAQGNSAAGLALVTKAKCQLFKC